MNGPRNKLAEIDSPNITWTKVLNSLIQTIKFLIPVT